MTCLTYIIALAVFANLEWWWAFWIVFVLGFVPATSDD